MHWICRLFRLFSQQGSWNVFCHKLGYTRVFEMTFHLPREDNSSGIQCRQPVASFHRVSLFLLVVLHRWGIIYQFFCMIFNSKEKRFPNLSKRYKITQFAFVLTSGYVNIFDLKIAFSSSWSIYWKKCV